MIEKIQMQKSLEAKKSKSKWVYFLLFIITLIALSYYLFHNKSESKNQEIEYITQKLKRDNLAVLVSATGNLEPTNSVDIGIEVSGTIKEIYVDYNDEVKVGQTLAKLDTTKLQMQLSSAKASYSIAKANLLESEVALKKRKTKLERAKEMYQNSKARVPSISEMDDYQFDYEMAKATYEANKARVEQSLFEVKTGEDNLAKAVVISSIDGIVLNKNVEIGQTIAATMQAPVLFTLAKDLSKMELIVSVDEADIGDIRSELNVTFNVDTYPKKTFIGNIRQVRLKPQEVNGVITYDTVVSVDNSELLLKPGMTATAQIITKTIKNRFIIPNSALRFSPKIPTKTTKGFSFAPSSVKQEPINLEKKDERSVWILRDNRAIKIVVEVIDSDGKFSAIKSKELNEDDEIIISQKSNNVK